MGLSDRVETDRRNIISMISCADDYGHNNEIAGLFFWELLGKRLDDDEISAYADEVASGDGYGEEDREEITDRLTRWRDGRG